MRVSSGQVSSLSGVFVFVLFRVFACLGLTEQHHGCHSFYGSPGLAMEPEGDIFAPINTTFVVECRSNPKLDIVASDLVFTKGLTESFAPFETQIVGDYTILLLTSEENPSEYNLYCRGPRKNFCLRKVRIGYPPREAGNFRCISLSWRTLECAFDLLSNPAHMNTDDYFLEYSALGKSVSGYKCNSKNLESCCVSLDGDECWQWGADPLLFPYYTSERFLNFTLWSKNSFGRRSYSYVIDQHKIMVPDPAVNYQVHPAGPFHLVLSWDLPPFLQIFPPGIIYRIHFTGPGVDEIVLGESQRAKSTSITIAVPGPGQTYTVSLSLRSGANPWKSGYSEDNLWSLPVRKRATTSSLPPLKAPELSPWGFQEWNWDSMKTLRSILIYWKPLPLEQEGGPMFRYLVRVLADGERVNIVPKRQTNSSALFDRLFTSVSYSFEIIPVNEVGEGESSLIEVKRSSEMPQGGINFPLAVFYPEQELYHLRWFTESDSGEENFTIFWCDNLQNDLDHGSFCEGAPHWGHFPLPQKVTEVTMSKQQLGNIDPHGELSFGVSSWGRSNGEVASSGITWSSCPTGDHRRNVSNSFTKLKVTDRGSSSAVFEWQIDCRTWLGVPQEVELRWCPGKHNSTGDCEGQDQSMFLMINLTSVSLSDLVADQVYTVWIRPLFTDRKSPEFNRPVFFKTTKKVLLRKTIILLTMGTLFGIMAILFALFYIHKWLSVSWTEASRKLNLPEGIYKPNVRRKATRDGGIKTTDVVSIPEGIAKDVYADKLGHKRLSTNSFSKFREEERVSFLNPNEHSAEELEGRPPYPIRETCASSKQAASTCLDNHSELSAYKDHKEFLPLEKMSGNNVNKETNSRYSGDLDKVPLACRTENQTYKKFVEHESDSNSVSLANSDAAHPYSVLLSNTSFQTPDKGYVKAVMAENDFANLVSHPHLTNTDMKSSKEAPLSYISSSVQENDVGYTKLVDLTRFITPVKKIGQDYFFSERNKDEESDSRSEETANMYDHSEFPAGVASKEANGPQPAVAVAPTGYISPNIHFDKTPNKGYIQLVSSYDFG